MRSRWGELMVHNMVLLIIGVILCCILGSTSCTRVLQSREEADIIHHTPTSSTEQVELSLLGIHYKSNVNGEPMTENYEREEKRIQDEERREEEEIIRARLHRAFEEWKNEFKRVERHNGQEEEEEGEGEGEPKRRVFHEVPSGPNPISNSLPGN